MNKLQKAMAKELWKVADFSRQERKEYLSTGSCIGYCNGKEDRINVDLHGSLSAKLYLLQDYIHTLAKEYEVPAEEIVDFLQFTVGN